MILNPKLAIYKALEIGGFMTLDKAIKGLKFDVRMKEHNLNSGVISEQELNKHLEQLPDLTPNTEKIVFEEEKNGAH